MKDKTKHNEKTHIERFSVFDFSNVTHFWGFTRGLLAVIVVLIVVSTLSNILVGLLIGKVPYQFTAECSVGNFTPTENSSMTHLPTELTDAKCRISAKGEAPILLLLRGG